MKTPEVVVNHPPNVKEVHLTWMNTTAESQSGIEEAYKLKPDLWGIPTGYKTRAGLNDVVTAIPIV